MVNSCCYSTEVDSLEEKDIKKWNEIKYPKVMLVESAFGFENEFIIKKPEDCKEFAWLLFQKDKSKDLRVFNDFDFITFINKNI